VEPYLPVKGMSDEEAVKRGLAMRMPQMLIKWSWQKLEMDASENVFVIGARGAYSLRGGVSSGFVPFESDGQLLETVLGYLQELGILPAK
jgi:hypothetical protein